MGPIGLPEAAPATCDESELIARVRQGDPVALGEVYRRHASGLMGVAQRLTGSRPDAEDVVHDVFVGLPEALERYEERGKLDAWLRRLTVRRALTELRRGRRDVALEAVTLKWADHSLDRAALEGALRQLPDKLRVVFVLREVEGYTHSEIAEILRIRRGTSEVRLHRAIRALRRLLEVE